MTGIRMVIPGLVMACMGCVTEVERDRAFSDDWAYVHSRGEGTWEPGGEVVLTGKGGRGPRSTLHVTEEGKRTLRIGGESRVSTDISLDGGSPDVKVKYKIGF